MSHQTTIERLRDPDTIALRTLRVVLLAAVGSLLLTASAKVQIPFWPVPLTMQTFVVMVLALGYGARLATGTVGLYLAQGAMGLPVFAAGGGLVYFTGPTGGYLVGFLVAAALMGHLADRGWHRSVPRALLAAFLGAAVMFACGVAWLSVLIGFGPAVASGLIPFLPGDLLKVVLAGLSVPGVLYLLKRGRRGS